jgi:hypothetical protein
MDLQPRTNLDPISFVLLATIALTFSLTSMVFGKCEDQEITVGFLDRSTDQSAPKANNSEISKGEFGAMDGMPFGDPNRPCKLALIPMAFSDITNGLQLERIQFLIFNPLTFLDQSKTVHFRFLATLSRTRNGEYPTTNLGGVIFDAKGNHTNALELKDLQNSRIFAVADTSVGGYIAQRIALEAHGFHVSLTADHFLTSQLSVIQKVIDTPGAIGFVRTGQLESYCHIKHCDTEKLFRILRLNLMNNEPGQRDGEKFPYAISTREYPEWAFVALPKAKQSTVNDVAIALLTLPQFPNAQNPEEQLSWVSPVNYITDVDQLEPPSEFSMFNPFDPEGAALDVYLAFFIVFSFSLLLLIERGRRRRNRPRTLRTYILFLPNVLACLSVGSTLVLVILWIGSLERLVETFVVHGDHRSPITALLLTTMAFLATALSAHYLSAQTTERGVVLTKLEELLERALAFSRSGSAGEAAAGENAAANAIWDEMQKYCKVNSVSEDELDAIAALVRSRRVAQAESTLPANVDKLRAEW